MNRGSGSREFGLGNEEGTLQLGEKPGRSSSRKRRPNVPALVRDTAADRRLRHSCRAETTGTKSRSDHDVPISEVMHGRSSCLFAPEATSCSIKHLLATGNGSRIGSQRLGKADFCRKTSYLSEAFTNAHIYSHTPTCVAISVGDRHYAGIRRCDKIHAKRGRKTSVGNSKPLFMAFTRLLLLLRRCTVLWMAERGRAIEGKT